MKRGYLFAALVLSSCILMSGCASIPDLSEDEEEMVTEYAASLLLKYDSENHSRLVSTDSYVNAYNTAVRIYEDSKQQYYDAIQAEEDARREEAKAQEELNAGYAENTTGPMHSSDGTGGALVVDARSIADFIGASGFSIDYAGYDILDSYPEDFDDFTFSMDATTGNDLLVIYFNVTNMLSGTNTLDVFNVNPTFKTSVNGDKYLSVFKTIILEDDMSVYLGDFSGNESKRLVLVTEVPDGTTLNSLGLRISIGEDSITKSLM